MGIRKLTSYVQDNASSLYKDEFNLRGQKLVFDGGCLYHVLLGRCDRRFGGDYYHIYYVFKSYFQKLKKIGVTPYIVLDGGSNIPLKNQTYCKRFLENVKALRKLTIKKKGQCSLPIPRFSQLLFIEILLELQINYVVAEGEADMLVATLANRLGCPLVSGDSDFFVVPVLHGVLPIDKLINLNPKANNKFVRYRSSTMAHHLKIKEVLLPMLAVIMGNDYSEQRFLRRIQSHCKAKQAQVQDKVKSICRYLSQFDSIESVIADICGEDTEFMDHVESVLGEFDLNSFEEECNELFPILNQVTSFSEKIVSIIEENMSVDKFLRYAVCHGIVYSSVLDIYNHGTLFVHCQCESLEEKSSSEASEELRSYLYVLLLHSKAIKQELDVKEFLRIEQGYEETSVQLSIPDWSCYFPIDILGSTYSMSDKINAFCKLTMFPTESLLNVRKEDRLFLISVRYWIQRSADSKCTLQIEHVQALVLCYFQLRSGQRFKRFDHMDLMTAHHYCRWQSILFYLLMLNVVFRFPFVPPIVSRVFQGNHVHKLYHLLNSGTNVRDLFSGSESGIFDIFMKVITWNIEPSCLIYKQSNPKKSRNRNRRSKNQRSGLGRNNSNQLHR